MGPSASCMPSFPYTLPSWNLLRALEAILLSRYIAGGLGKGGWGRWGGGEGVGGRGSELEGVGGLSWGEDGCGDWFGVESRWRLGVSWSGWNWQKAVAKRRSATKNFGDWNPSLPLPPPPPPPPPAPSSRPAPTRAGDPGGALRRRLLGRRSPGHRRRGWHAALVEPVHEANRCEAAVTRCVARIFSPFFFFVCVCVCVCPFVLVLCVLCLFSICFCCFFVFVLFVFFCFLFRWVDLGVSFYVPRVSMTL